MPDLAGHRMGQGTWRMGEAPARADAEVAALRLGIELGLTLIDTAEMYGDGGSERVVARAMAGLRDRVFLVSKVMPQNASRRGTVAACEASLRRLGTGRIDLYLLHWPGRTPVAETVEAFETLREAGKIGAWGVSNFDTAGMARVPAGCATNQVLYNPGSRGIEFDLLPRCRDQAMPVMAYSPVGQGGRLLASPALRRVAARHGATPAQVAIAWTIRAPGVVTIPKAADPAHVRQNAAALDLRLTAEDLADIDAGHAPPRRAEPLDIL